MYYYMYQVVLPTLAYCLGGSEMCRFYGCNRVLDTCKIALRKQRLYLGSIARRSRSIQDGPPQHRRLIRFELTQLSQ